MNPDTVAPPADGKRFGLGVVMAAMAVVAVLSPTFAGEGGASLMRL